MRDSFEKPKSEQEINEYIYGSDKETSIIDLCIHMETWFKEKDPRAKRKKKAKKGKKNPKKEEKKPKREKKKPKRGIKK